MIEEQGYLCDLWYHFHVPLAELFEKCSKLSCAPIGTQLIRA